MTVETSLTDSSHCGSLPHASIFRMQFKIQLLAGYVDLNSLTCLLMQLFECKSGSSSTKHSCSAIWSASRRFIEKSSNCLSDQRLLARCLKVSIFNCGGKCFGSQMTWLPIDKPVIIIKWIKFFKSDIANKL